MTETIFPKRVANEISTVLRTVLGSSRFPVNVKEVAQEISLGKFPSDPITMIKGGDLPGFEGCLVPAPIGKKGWGILYNNSYTKGRINFTLGHEFGHYLLHRISYPNGFQCSTDDLANWESEYSQLEQQANEFAATLLMPLDDFRKQINEKKRPTLDQLGECACRYDVSLIASILRWLQYTQKRSILVVARERFVLWSRSSKTALKSGLYVKTRGVRPIEVPRDSLAYKVTTMSGQNSNEHVKPTWFGERCIEHTLFSDQYDFSISLLHFGDFEPQFRIAQ